MTRRYGFHISEQTYSIFSDKVAPMRVKNCSKLSTVRSLPTHSRRVHSCSIWETSVRYLCPLPYWISSTPMARIGPRRRCASPHSTTYSTAWRTLSHELRKDAAVSCQDSFRAQCAKNNM